MSSLTDILPREQADAPFYLGIDVGGTGIKFGIVDAHGKTVGRTRIPTVQENGPEDACQRMKQTAASLAADCDVEEGAIDYVGLATPGTMDANAGMLLQPHNLRAWWNFPIRDHLRDVLAKPVAFINDANAAAYGEYWIGSGADYRSMVLFTLGTGIGSGIIVDGMLITGEHSHGSECGHTIIDSGPDARICGCGCPGHLEAYASAKAVIQRTEEILSTEQVTTLRARVANGESLTPLMVAEEAEAGDMVALDIVMKTAEYLSCGAVNAIHVIDPNAVVYGGAMTFGGSDSELGQRFLNHIRQEVSRRAFPSLENRTQIDFALLGGHAGYIGAAGFARAAAQAS